MPDCVVRDGDNPQGCTLRMKPVTMSDTTTGRVVADDPDGSHRSKTAEVLRVQPFVKAFKGWRVPEKET